jgi:hypothetical protein
MFNTISELDKLLKPLLSFIIPYVPINLFEVYIKGLIQDDRYFSSLNISRKTQQFKLWKIYTVLQYKINWSKVLYEFAKLLFININPDNWYLVIDATPIEQEHAQYRLTKRGKVPIKGMKNVLQNQMLGLILTDGLTTIVLDYRLWFPKKVSRPYDYVKQTDLALDLIKKYHLTSLKVRTILFDSYFSSKKIIKWLNNNNYVWFTRLKKNRTIFIGGDKSSIEGLNLGTNQSQTCELKGINGWIKVLKISLQDEDVYVATNDTTLENSRIEKSYRMRWEIEIFHKEAKQRLGLNYIRMENYRSYKNHIGFVCLAYSLLSALQQVSMPNISSVKRTIQDELYSTHDAIDRFGSLAVS